MKKCRWVRRGQGRCSGHTLIEVMIAVLIIGIVSAGAMQAIFSMNVMSQEAREVTIALNDANAILERIKVTPLASLPVSSQVNASTVWTDLASFVSNSLSSEQILITGDAGAQLRQVVVTIQWTGPRNKAMQLQFLTQRSAV